MQTVIKAALFLFSIFASLFSTQTSLCAGSLSPIGPSGGLLVTSPIGLDSHLIAVCPPSGFYLLNYNFYYFADRFNTRSGTKARSGMLRHFETDVYGEIARFIWVPEQDIRILGGKWAPDFAISGIHKRIRTALFDESKTGFGDLIFAPVNLFYRWGNIHSIIYTDFIAPTGRYEKQDPVNIGNNHWTFKPAMFLTYWNEPWEITGGFHFYLHTKNTEFIDPRNGDETSHKPGEAFHIDYGISRSFKTVFENFRLGLNGYFWKDVSRDEVGGHPVSGTETEVLSLGPGVRWSWAKITFVLKGQFEVYAKNRPQGQFLWLRFIYRL